MYNLQCLKFLLHIGVPNEPIHNYVLVMWRLSLIDYLAKNQRRI